MPSSPLAHPALVVALLALGRVSGVGAQEAPGPRVLTSFLPVYSVAATIAGDRAKVENWLPTGVDPHDFQFSPRDMRRLRDADLLIVGGLKLEGWSEAQLRRISGHDRLQVLELAAGLPADALLHAEEEEHAHGKDDHDHDHGDGPNPHFWLDPQLLAKTVPAVVAAFTSLDPEGAAVYARNAEALVARLGQLDREFEEGLRSANTPFITYHDAFPYLARRYGLNLAGVVEATAAEQPSARRLGALTALVRKEGVKVLFTDGKPTRLARRLAEDLKLRVAELETLETGPLEPGAYEAGMRRNLKTLREALSAPAQP